MSKICIVLPHHWGAARGGAEYQADLLARHLSNAKNHHVLYLARHIPDDVSSYNYEVREFSGPKLPGGLRWGRSVDSRALYRALDKYRPHAIIQMVACSYTGVCAYYASRLQAKFYWYLASDMDIDPHPNVGIRGPAKFVDRFIFRYGARNAGYIVAQTETQAQTLKEREGRAADFIISNFLEAVDAPAKQQSPIRVLWIANIKQLKRPDLFLDLAARFANSPNVEFRMAGRPADQKIVCDILRRTKNSGNICYLGELSLEDVENELSKAHVLINTSDYEGFPNTFIQAWLRCVPVLSLHVDPDGIMTKQQFGSKLTTLDNMERALSNAIERPDLLLEMGMRARRYALEHHSMNNLTPLIEHLSQ